MSDTKPKSKRAAPTQPELEQTEEKRPVGTLVETEIEHNGEKLKVKHWKITRLMRQQAMEVASVAFRKKFPNEKGMLPSAFESELARMSIKWWDRKISTIPASAGGFDFLEDIELGDKIAEVIGIQRTLESLSPKEESPEVQDAKNSRRVATKAPQSPS